MDTRKYRLQSPAPRTSRMLRTGAALFPAGLRVDAACAKSGYRATAARYAPRSGNSSTIPDRCRRSTGMSTRSGGRSAPPGRCWRGLGKGEVVRREIRMPSVGIVQRVKSARLGICAQSRGDAQNLKAVSAPSAGNLGRPSVASGKRQDLAQVLDLARLAGFEPTTPAFGVHKWTQSKVPSIA